ncbi:dolichol-P-glucose transferase [Halobacteriales archaeon SW_7_68_16]|nr:MAG: dolichol-P-glucose transferase [Halobacteriales archaeon SW_7_68_16]
MSRSVGIVIPAYEPSVERLVSYVEAIDAAIEPTAIRVEIDDPDEDVLDALCGTVATVRAVDARGGKGAAITRGFETLSTDVLAFADADGSTAAESLADVIAPTAEGRADLAVGSRRHPDADIRSHQTFARRGLGDVFAALARRTLGVDLHDFQCGAKAMTQGAWSRVRGEIYEGGFAWDIEVIAMAAAGGERIVEVPVAWTDYPDSTVSTVNATVELGTTLLASRYRAGRPEDDRLAGSLPSSRSTALVDRVARDD